MGHCETCLPLLFIAANRSVRPPTLPRNMNTIRIRRDAVPSDAVMPRVRPTVPIAEAVSNMQL